MIFESASPSLMLAAGELVRLPAGACATIVCAQGSVWVTRDHDPQDAVLSSGDSLAIGEGALAVAQAFEASMIHLREGSARCPQGAARPARGGWLAAALR